MLLFRFFLECGLFRLCPPYVTALLAWLSSKMLWWIIFFISFNEISKTNYSEVNAFCNAVHTFKSSPNELVILFVPSYFFSPLWQQNVYFLLRANPWVRCPRTLVIIPDLHSKCHLLISFTNNIFNVIFTQFVFVNFLSTYYLKFFKGW